MATVGKNILDNLTTGMYADSKVIYREYIQNACDQIDKAVKSGLLPSRKDGLVEIYIDEKKRYISIRDNATGVARASFKSDLGDIANSGKERGVDKGFRGIGRLCGLAYCKTLKFTTSAKGESSKSIMICDAQKMRAMLLEAKKYTLDEIWDAIIEYDDSQPESADAHYFEVELVDINRENTDLLDGKKVRDYLSFVAPVPYKNTFLLREQIYSHANEVGYCIEEYNISVNGSQIFKEYTTRLKEQSGSHLQNYDEIFELEFKDFYNTKGSLIAWMWIGLSRFEKKIPKVNLMRGLRVRTSNIQIGEDNVLTPLFKESRGNYYFVGEVYCASKELVPNSQRNYYQENEARVELENVLRAYFYDVLHKLYYDANRIKNDCKKQEEYIAKTKEYAQKDSSNGFVDEEDRQKLLFEIEQKKKSAEEARKRLEKLNDGDEISPLSKVSKSIKKKYNADVLTRKAKTAGIPIPADEKKKPYVTATMSKLSRNERKIVSRILTIITDLAPQDVAERIINRIREELK